LSIIYGSISRGRAIYRFNTVQDCSIGVPSWKSTKFQFLSIHFTNIILCCQYFVDCFYYFFFQNLLTHPAQHKCTVPCCQDVTKFMCKFPRTIILHYVVIVQYFVYVSHVNTGFFYLLCFDEACIKYACIIESIE